MINSIISFILHFGLKDHSLVGLIRTVPVYQCLLAPSHLTPERNLQNFLISFAFIGELYPNSPSILELLFTVYKYVTLHSVERPYCCGLFNAHTFIQLGLCHPILQRSPSLLSALLVQSEMAGNVQLTSQIKRWSPVA
ncbi:MAG: hypothetical protein BGO90_15690 [Legionella sp. 40-6]|nr:MAG: hypothetical protein BGO90_15690 [Legionella sp. 40-6]